MNSDHFQDSKVKCRKRVKQRREQETQKANENDLQLVQAGRNDHPVTVVSTVARKLGMFLSKYLTDIFCRIMNLLRVPISLVIVGLLLYVVGMQFYARLIAPFTSLSLICNIPLPYILSFCPSDKIARISEASNPETVVDFPALTQLQVHAFNELLDENAHTSRIGFELKKAEAATGDLAVIVQVSQLRGRENLAASLVDFGVEASKAGWSLIMLDGRINAAMDRIIAMNDYTLKEIGRLSELTSQSSTSSLSFGDSASYVGKTFDKALSFMDSELRSLKSIAESTLKDQTSLEEKLKTIHLLVAMEEVSINVEKDNLLWNLWGVLGSNRKELRQYDYNLALLQTISVHRRQAQSFVLNILQTLQETSVNLELLRGRIAHSYLDDDLTLPLEVHIQSLKAGIQRLIGNKLRERTVEPKKSISEGREGSLLSLPEAT